MWAYDWTIEWPGGGIAVKQPPDWASGLPGSWTYRSFHNNPESGLSPQKTRPTTDDLILQEANFALGTPTSTTLQGEIVSVPSASKGRSVRAQTVSPQGSR